MKINLGRKIFIKSKIVSRFMNADVSIISRISFNKIYNIEY